MTYAIRLGLWCIATALFSLPLLSQDDYFNTAIVVLDGDPLLVTLDDRDEISDILMYLPDYFESNRTKEDYEELLRNTYVLGALEINPQLRFLAFTADSELISDQGIRDIRYIAGQYSLSVQPMDVVVTLSDLPVSNARADQIIRGLSSFGVDTEDIVLYLKPASSNDADDIARIAVRKDPD